MPTKHGIWFDFDRHIDIHRNNLAGWKSSMVVPADYDEIWEAPDVHKFSLKFQFQINGYEIKITKLSKVSFKVIKNNVQIPDKVKTLEYSYVGYNQHKNHMIRYCSPHSDTYDKQLPWHHKHHRHEFDGYIENILIYSEDDRPYLDRFKKNFLSGKQNVSIQFQNIEWPHVSEFLSEIYKL